MTRAAPVCRRRAEPGSRPAMLPAGELSRRRQGQEPHAEEPVALAGRTDPAAARGAARGDAGAGGRGFADRAGLAAWTRVGGARHGASDRARSAAAAPAGAAAKAGAGADCGAADRSGGQAGDGAGARRVAEKVSATTNAEYFAERKAPANIEAFARILNRTGGDHPVLMMNCPNRTFRVLDRSMRFGSIRLARPPRRRRGTAEITDLVMTSSRHVRQRCCRRAGEYSSQAPFRFVIACPDPSWRIGDPVVGLVDARTLGVGRRMLDVSVDLATGLPKGSSAAPARGATPERPNTLALRAGCRASSRSAAEPGVVAARAWAGWRRLYGAGDRGWHAPAYRCRSRTRFPSPTARNCVACASGRRR